jgi:hypothetical protein
MTVHVLNRPSTMMWHHDRSHARRSPPANADTPKRFGVPTGTDTLFEPAEQKPHFGAPGPAILVCFVQHQKRPVLCEGTIEKRAIQRADELVLQH